MIEYVGIDVSKNKLDCTWLRDKASGKLKTKVFANDGSGHDELLVWLESMISCSASDILVTLEPTNVYHEALAYRLYESGYQVLMANPGKAKAFAQSQNQQSKTDKKDSVILARYGWKSSPEMALVRLFPERCCICFIANRLRRLVKQVLMWAWFLFNVSQGYLKEKRRSVNVGQVVFEPSCIWRL